MMEELKKELWSLIHKWRTTPDSSQSLNDFVDGVYARGYSDALNNDSPALPEYTN
jgi:hypothetical protein